MSTVGSVERKPRAFRFGVVCGGTKSAAEWASLARRVEELGYSVLLSSDHLDLSGAHFSTLSAMPALAAAAAVTRQIALGTSVLNQDLRHPAVLAREAATLDILSDGRLELGLGAGAVEYEYRWAGIQFDGIGTRIGRLAEYVAVVKALLEQDKVDFEGEHFRISEMPGVPAPVQRPRPPIMLGGTFRRMLSLAAREADIVSIALGTCRPSTAAAMDERIEWLRAAAGPRFAQLELNNMVGVLVMSDGDRRGALRREIDSQGAQLYTEFLTEEELLDSPSALIGSAERMVDQLLSWRERWGISYVAIAYPQMEQFATVVGELSGR